VFVVFERYERYVLNYDFVYACILFSYGLDLQGGDVGFDLVFDNTSFCSVDSWSQGRSLDTIDNPVDVMNLMDVLTSCVFADRIIIPGFVHDKIAEKRDSGILALTRKGLGKDLFTVVDESEEVFRARLVEIGRTVAGRLALSPKDSVEYLSAPRNISSAERSHVEDIHFLLFHVDRQSLLDSIVEDPFGYANKKFGAAGFTIAVTPELCCFFDRYKDLWTICWTQRLLDLQMYEKNISLSESVNALYNVNYLRHKSIKDVVSYRDQTLLTELRNLFSTVAEGGKNSCGKCSIELPGLQKHLIRKCNGKSSRIWDEVLRLRERSAFLRKKLTKIKKHTERGDVYSGWKDFKMEVIDYSKRLAQKDANSSKGLSVRFWPPEVNFDLDFVLGLIKQSVIKSNLSVFSEVANTSLEGIRSEKAFEELIFLGQGFKKE